MLIISLLQTDWEETSLVQWKMGGLDGEGLKMCDISRHEWFLDSHQTVNFQSLFPIPTVFFHQAYNYSTLVSLFHILSLLFFFLGGRFIYSFMGVGVFLCCISLLGCIAAEAFSGCCLCFVSHLKWIFFIFLWVCLKVLTHLLWKQPCVETLGLSVYFQISVILFYLCFLIPWPVEMLVFDDHHSIHSTRGCLGDIHQRWSSLGKGSFFLPPSSPCINVTAFATISVISKIENM